LCHKLYAVTKTKIDYIEEEEKRNSLVQKERRKRGDFHSSLYFLVMRTLLLTTALPICSTYNMPKTKVKKS